MFQGTLIAGMLPHPNDVYHLTVGVVVCGMKFSCQWNFKSMGF